MTRDTRRQAVLIAGVTVAVVWWLGGFLLTGNATLGFRDAASFYEPRWAWLVQHWAQGIFPQWNPLENAGTDVVADPTYGVFYPFKVLLLAPLAWPLPYHIFLLFHSILAWGAAYRAARCMPASPFAAALGATSYAFGGHVLAQTHNAV
ncbi:MAG TPA: hypothetical protein ENJ50_00330, partial [Planctomycetaceae bacterium]|nr:hypothetical protein [Planctomycetaceae bacterium]